MQPIEATHYTIHFSADCYVFLDAFLEKNSYSKVFILVDSNTNELCLTHFLSLLTCEVPLEIIEIEPGEENKTIATCVELWRTLTELGSDRKSLLINLGGGVISDIGGFVASTFKRGIAFLNVPTTLLAMVDAAIGGKNGVDLDHLKNQIGVINPPKAVLIDPAFLASLPQNEMRSGLAEMLKHGLIYDKNYWDKFKNLQQTSADELDQLIYQSVVIKNAIVAQDPQEKGLRKALNFGHTLGHAIESYFLENTEKESLLHGEAIAAGMILESYIALQKELLKPEEYDEIKTTLCAIFDRVNFESKDIQPIVDLLIHDKKNEFGAVQFALLEGIGKSKINQSADYQWIIDSFDAYKSY